MLEYANKRREVVVSVYRRQVILLKVVNLLSTWSVATTLAHCFTFASGVMWIHR